MKRSRSSEDDVTGHNQRAAVIIVLESLPDEDLVLLLLEVQPENVLTRYNSLLANETEHSGSQSSSTLNTLSKREKIESILRTLSDEQITVLLEKIEQYRLEGSHTTRMRRC